MSSPDLNALKEQIEELRGDPDSNPLCDFATKSGITTNTLPIKNRRVLKGHFGKIYAINWSKDTSLVSASQDGKLIIWDGMSTNKLFAIPLRSSWVMTCAFSPSGEQVACGGLDNICSVYKLSQQGATGDNRMAFRELMQHEGYLSCCRFISDTEIITSSGDSTCILWDISQKTPVTTFTDHTGDVMTVSVNKVKHIFATGSCDSTSKIFDYRAGPNAVMTFTGHESDINSIDFLAATDTVGTGSDDSSCRVFDLRSHRQLARFCSERILCGITSVASSKTGKYLFAGYDDYNCYGWDVLTSEICAQVTGHENRVSCLGVSKDGHALATGSWDTFVKIWA